MDLSLYQLRPIMADDDATVFTLIQTVLTEFGCVGEGYAYADVHLPALSQYYASFGQRNHMPLAAYWVAEHVETRYIHGVGGFAPLCEGPETTCELQKLYLLPPSRGIGLGRRLMTTIIEAARQAGYHHMYLETTANMQAAQGLYRAMGFSPLSSHRGNTGHQANCTVYFELDLNHFERISPSHVQTSIQASC